MMKQFTAVRNPHIAYNLLLFVMAFTFLIVWLPLLRSPFDGVSYQWGENYFGMFFSGKGISADYWFLVLQFAFYVVLFWSVYGAKNRKLFYGLLGVWWVHFFGHMLYSIASDPDASFRGDTLGVVVPLSYIVIPLVMVAIALIVWVIRIDMKAEEVSIPWAKRNRLMAWIIFGPLPLQFILLRFGPDPSLMDQIGVLITIAQCLTIPLVLRPYASASVAETENVFIGAKT